ncbi:MAG: hypothetical protein RL701_2064 [Pseudomonadota bacterium]|jgi:hypothetical protein
MTIGLPANIHDLVRAHLRQAFPDAHIDATDIEGCVLALQRRGQLGPEEKAPFAASTLAPYRDALDAFAATLAVGSWNADGEQHTARHAGDALDYYWAHAKHTRKSPAGYAPFEGHLALVRVRLPERTPRRFSTPIGTVEPADHLLGSVFEANDKYAQPLGYALQRLDLITPPRQLLRFGAISVLLGYRSATGLPTCFILEAGTATGQAKVLYLGKTLSTTINRRTGYQPTAFSCSDNAYTGKLTVAGDEPLRLQVTARDIIAGTTSAAPYMEIDVHFEKQTGDVQSIWPGFHILRAAAIVEKRKLEGLENTCEDT